MISLNNAVFLVNSFCYFIIVIFSKRKKLCFDDCIYKIKVDITGSKQITSLLENANFFEKICLMGMLFLHHGTCSETKLLEV